MRAAGQELEPSFDDRYTLERMSWPSHYPADCCPPDDAEVARGPLYRFVPVNDGVVPKAFTCDLHNPHSNHTDADPCERAGLSVYRNQKTAEDALAFSPYLRKKKKIAVWQGPGPVGVFKPTGPRPGHYTWWAPDGTQYVTMFSLVTGTQR